MLYFPSVLGNFDFKRDDWNYSQTLSDQRIPPGTLNFLKEIDASTVWNLWPWFKMFTKLNHWVTQIFQSQLIKIYFHEWFWWKLTHLLERRNIYLGVQAVGEKTYEKILPKSSPKVNWKLFFHYNILRKISFSRSGWKRVIKNCWGKPRRTLIE